MLTEEAPLPALCGVSAGSESAEIIHCESNNPGSLHLADPLLTLSDGQGPSSSQTLSLDGKRGNTSDPAANGESIEVREEPPSPRMGACSENRRPQCVNGRGPDNAIDLLQLDTAAVPLPNPVDGNEPSNPAAKFTESIRDLLRGAPKRFKEIYPMIAERQPEDCRVDGNRVCLGRMEWLHEIERDLYEVAVNRDGLWHLKEAAAARYDREELYENVWAEPIQKLAKEYGVSDVALARACKRRRVPVPGRGYWAKKAAGKAVPNRPPLCDVSADPQIAEIAQCESNSPGTSHLAKPLLTSCDGQGPSSSQELSVGEKPGNTSVPVGSGESIEVREEPPRPRMGVCSENRPPQGVNGGEPDDAIHPLQLDTATVPLPNPVDGNEPSEPAAKFTESIRDLLRGAPKRFKEIYPMIAERQPEDCPAHGNKVSFTGMAWLHEIQRELQEIGVFKNGLWYLKEEIPSPVPIGRIGYSNETEEQAASEHRNGKAERDSSIGKELRGIFE